MPQNVEVKKLTGARRFRIKTTWLSQYIVLQVEETHSIWSNYGDKKETTYWRDAKVEDLSVDAASTKLNFGE